MCFRKLLENWIKNKIFWPLVKYRYSKSFSSYVKKRYLIGKYMYMNTYINSFFWFFPSINLCYNFHIKSKLNKSFIQLINMIVIMTGLISGPGAGRVSECQVGCGHWRPPLSPLQPPHQSPRQLVSGPDSVYKPPTLSDLVPGAALRFSSPKGAKRATQA